MPLCEQSAMLYLFVLAAAMVGASETLLGSRRLPGELVSRPSAQSNASSWSPGLECPFADLDLSPSLLSNKAVAELIHEGRLEEMLACSLLALEHDEAELMSAYVREVIVGNVGAMQRALSAHRPQATRLHHNLAGLKPDWPHTDTAVEDAPRLDRSIAVYDGALGAGTCEDIIALFERSKAFEGSVQSNGEWLIKPEVKKVWEVYVSDEALESAEWLWVERLTISTTTKYLNLYEASNTILREMRSPLEDEGVRLKRYQDASEHHHWHSDSGQEPRCASPRVLAVLLYLSEPEEGGETVFLHHNVSVTPRCGRMLIFPAACPFIHAGRRVRRGKKYALAMMINR